MKSSNEEIRHGLALYSDNEEEWERVKSCASEGDLLRLVNFTFNKYFLFLLAFIYQNIHFQVLKDNNISCIEYLLAF